MKLSDGDLAAYAAENIAEANVPPGVYETFDDLVADAEKIVCSEWWAEQFPNAPVELIAEKRRSSANASIAGRCSGEAGYLSILRVHWDKNSLAHELAHIATDATGHDDRWRHAHVAIVRQFQNFHAAVELASQYGIMFSVLGDDS